MKKRKIKYKIHHRDLGSEWVEGYAIESDLPVRFCIRKQCRRAWRGDHFDTGLALSAWGSTLAECIRKTEELIRFNIENGTYQKRMAEIEAGKP